MDGFLQKLVKVGKNNRPIYTHTYTHTYFAKKICMKKLK